MTDNSWLRNWDAGGTRVSGVAYPQGPFKTLIRQDGYPYPSLRVRVLKGRGRGMKKKPEGYPGQSLAVCHIGGGSLAFSRRLRIAG
jgi:hypothetical protein